MNLTDKIKSNFRSQLILQNQAAKLQQKLQDLASEEQRLRGSLDVLAELYQEETGVAFQVAIQSPEWQKTINDLQKEVNDTVGSEVPPIIDADFKNIDKNVNASTDHEDPTASGPQASPESESGRDLSKIPKVIVD